MEEIFKFYKHSFNRAHRVVKTYEVSNYGRVKCNGELITPSVFSSGYKQCGSFFIHRAVAELFVPNPDNKKEVDHIDGDRLNNFATNLQWISHKENMRNPHTVKRISNHRKYTACGNQNAKGSHSNLGQHWTLGLDGKRIYSKEE